MSRASPAEHTETLARVCLAPRPDGEPPGCLLLGLRCGSSVFGGAPARPRPLPQQMGGYLAAA